MYQGNRGIATNGSNRKENNLSKDVEFLHHIQKKNITTLGKNISHHCLTLQCGILEENKQAFCYAGDWGGQLNLATGVFSRCYASRIKQDIFKDITKPIAFCAIGNHCHSLFCMNSSHFLSLGMIPDQYQDVSYAQLRNRSEASWYTERMQTALSGKLKDSNPCYNGKMKLKTELYAIIDEGLNEAYKLKDALRKGKGNAKK